MANTRDGYVCILSPSTLDSFKILRTRLTAAQLWSTHKSRYGNDMKISMYYSTARVSHAMLANNKLRRKYQSNAGLFEKRAYVDADRICARITGSTARNYSFTAYGQSEEPSTQEYPLDENEPDLIELSADEVMEISSSESSRDESVYAYSSESEATTARVQQYITRRITLGNIRAYDRWFEHVLAGNCSDIELGGIYDSLELHIAFEEWVSENNVDYVGTRAQFQAAIDERNFERDHNGWYIIQ